MCPLPKDREAQASWEFTRAARRAAAAARRHQTTVPTRTGGPTFQTQSGVRAASRTSATSSLLRRSLTRRTPISLMWVGGHWHPSVGLAGRAACTQGPGSGRPGPQAPRVPAPGVARQQARSGGQVSGSRTCWGRARSPEPPPCSQPAFPGGVPGPGTDRPLHGNVCMPKPALSTFLF